MTNHNPHTTALPIHAPDQKTKRWAALGVLMLPVLLVSIDNTVPVSYTHLTLPTKRIV